MQTVDIKVLNLQPGHTTWETIQVASEVTADSALKTLGKKCGIKPFVLPLFNLKTSRGHWLAPSQVLMELKSKEFPLFFKIRFKVPLAKRLNQLDRDAFIYFYRQVRYEYIKGDIRTSLQRQQSKLRTWLPFMPKDDTPEKEQEKRYKFYFNINAAAMNMTVDILQEEKEVKEVVRNISKYFPYEDNFEKILASPRVKSHAQNIINYYIDKNPSVIDVMGTFVDLMEEVPKYFEEAFALELQDTSSVLKTRLVIKPPFKCTDGNVNNKETKEERETKLELQDPNAESSDKSEVLCLLDEVTNLASDFDDNRLVVQLGRSNGQPIKLTFEAEKDKISFLTCVCGYYRLCEKWTFSLCSAIIYPEHQMKPQFAVHGPVNFDFVVEKFRQKGQGKTAPYLLHQDMNDYDSIILHYIMEDNISRPANLTIHRTSGGFRVDSTYSVLKDHIFPTLQDIILFLKDEGRNNTPIVIKECLYTSEFDVALTLLLCRSEAKLKNDVLTKSKPTEQPKVFMYDQLCQYKDTIVSGTFTNVCKVAWRSGKASSVRLFAMKQLKPEYQEKKWAEFSHTSYKVMNWDDPTFVKVQGICMHTFLTPQALIMDYFPLGPLDQYLRRKDVVCSELDMLEACVSLSKALWYLEEKQMYHGKIRASNVYVYEHTSSSFQIKLGFPSLTEQFVWDKSHLHWMPLEIPIDEEDNFHTKHYSIKADVWALATTFWEIFTDGQTPPVSESARVTREQLWNGYRLPMPEKLSTELKSIYNDVMRQCWNPLPDFRKDAQVVLRDVNQLLFKVHNRKFMHNYVTIDDDHEVANGSDVTLTEYQHTGETILTNLSNQTINPILPTSTSSNPPARNETRNYNSVAGDGLKMAPVHNDFMTRLIKSGGFSNLEDLKKSLMGCFDNHSETSSVDQLLSRPGSSLSGSLFHDMSGFTSQTSLASLSTLYSMTSIYELTSDNQLELNEDSPLGEGNFGIVYSGVMNKMNGEWDQVAVKLLKDSADQASTDTLERELNIMKDLHHDNIVRIKGIFRNTSKVMIIMEFISGGPLDRYLQVHRDTILNGSCAQLFLFAQNIVDGMIYLGRKGIIHRDLAARNILVASDEQVKISDFGLARPVENDAYVMRSGTSIPVRWLALESLKQNLYSFKSDVWAFAVTLWEMFSFGATPYLEGCEHLFKVGASIDEQRQDTFEWQNQIERGAKLPKPPMCPNLVYALMLPCWHSDPKWRPSFNDLKNELKTVELQVT